jgi:hypothetical protein
MGNLVGLRIVRGGIGGLLTLIRRGCLFLGLFDGLGLIEGVVRRGGREFVWSHGLDEDLGRRTLVKSRQDGCLVDDDDADAWGRLDKGGFIFTILILSKLTSTLAPEFYHDGEITIIDGS